MEYTRSAFDNDFKDILPNGFSFESGLDLNLITWTKKYIDRTESIQFTVRESFDGGFYIIQIGGYVYYPKIERMLEDFKISSEYLYTIREIQYYGRFLPNELMEESIRSRELFQTWSVKLLQILSDVFFPFFRDFSSIELMAAKFEEKEYFEWGSKVQNAVLFHKIALIQKLAQHPSFSKNLILFRDKLKEISSFDLTFLDSLSKFDELFKEDLI